MQIKPINLSVCLLGSATKMVRYSQNVVQVKVIKQQLHENQHSESYFIYIHRLIYTCNFHISRLICVKFGSEYLQVTEAFKIGAVKGILHFRPSINYCPHFTE